MNIQQYVIPAHKKRDLEIFRQISQAEVGGGVVNGEMRADAKRALEELTLIPVPLPSPGLSHKERKKIDRLARRTVKAIGLRRRAKDYPVPDWVKRSGKRTEYYRARLKFEIKVRKGYKEHDIA